MAVDPTTRTNDGPSAPPNGPDQAGFQRAAAPPAPQPPAPGSAPIDVAHLPPGPLRGADYERVVSRLQFLDHKYDPESTQDRILNAFTGAMNDPNRVVTADERREHEALSIRFAQTLNPPPTPAEARLDAMRASPLGTIAWVALRETGASERSQDAALQLGGALEGIGAGLAGMRGNPGTPFLGNQTRLPMPEAYRPSFGNGGRELVNPGQQDKHAPETALPGRSVLTAHPQELLDRFAGRGQPANAVPRGQPGFRERFDTGGQVIGQCTLPDGQSLPTTLGIIHYSNNGAHIVPATPRPASVAP